MEAITTTVVDLYDAFHILMDAPRSTTPWRLAVYRVEAAWLSIVSHYLNPSKALSAPSEELLSNLHCARRSLYDSEIDDVYEECYAEPFEQFRVAFRRMYDMRLGVPYITAGSRKEQDVRETYLCWL